MESKKETLAILKKIRKKVEKMPYEWWAKFNKLIRLKDVLKIIDKEIKKTENGLR